jgi:hypothetical protein
MREDGARCPQVWPVLCLLALLLPVSWSCKLPQSGPSHASAGSASEAERTRKMEEKAAEIERHAEEIKTMEGTDQEKIDAMNKLEQERRELNEMAEEGQKSP